MGRALIAMCARSLHTARNFMFVKFLHLTARAMGALNSSKFKANRCCRFRIERALAGGQEVASSNPVVPTVIQNEPFGEYVEGLSEIHFQHARTDRGLIDVAYQTGVEQNDFEFLGNWNKSNGKRLASLKLHMSATGDYRVSPEKVRRRAIPYQWCAGSGGNSHRAKSQRSLHSHESTGNVAMSVSKVGKLEKSR